MHYGLQVRARIGCLALVSVLALGSITSRVPAQDKQDEGPKPLPKDVNVLFDGKDLSKWLKYTKDEKKLTKAAWAVKDGYMEVAVGTGDIMTKDKFGPDFQLHVEFWLPLMAKEKGQARANSGIYLQGRYEVQVLDSYMNPTYADGACGALYGLIAPSKNASKPPQHWQTFDIEFHAPRVDAKTKQVTKKGRITVIHNDETVIDKGEFDKVTGGAMDMKLDTPGPIRLQDHKAAVRYRNIWLKPMLPVY